MKYLFYLLLLASVLYIGGRAIVARNNRSVRLIELEGMTADRAQDQRMKRLAEPLVYSTTTPAPSPTPAKPGAWMWENRGGNLAR